MTQIQKRPRFKNDPNSKMTQFQKWPKFKNDLNSKMTQNQKSKTTQIQKWPKLKNDPEGQRTRSGPELRRNGRFYVRPKSGFWPKNGSYPKKSPKMTFPPLIIWAKATFFFEQLFPGVARTWWTWRSEPFFLCKRLACQIIYYFFAIFELRKQIFILNEASIHTFPSQKLNYAWSLES